MCIRKLKPYKLRVLCIGSLLALTNVYADDRGPGFSISGMEGNFAQVNVDGLWPLFDETHNLFYIAPQALYSRSNEYSGSIGTGVRHQFGDSAILGAYLFNDYDRAPSGHLFSFLSPGIEMLTNRVDFSVNLYLPIGNPKNNTGESFASDDGDYRYVSFSGHDQIDQIVNNYESVGLGADAELSYRLPFLNNNTKVALGGYYFNPESATAITGAAARIEIPLNPRLALSVSDSYDNVFHNTIKVGLTLDLGSRDTHFYSQANSSQLTDRMTDPIQRNLASTIGGAKTNQPVVQTQQFTGNYAIFESNIWFFSPSGSTPESGITDNSCTADHPCAWNQNNLAGVNSVSTNANLYVSSGSYPSSGELTIYSGQSIFGRSQDFIAPVSGADRPQLYGALDLQGKNHLQDLILVSDGGNDTTGITLDDDASVTLKDLQIGSDINHPYTVGIASGNNDQLELEDCQILTSNDLSLLNNPIVGIKVHFSKGNWKFSFLKEKQVVNDFQLLNQAKALE